jgi:hypothetical protein
MTRIGRCQIKTHNLLAMLPPGETISPRSKFPQTASINSTATFARLSSRSGQGKIDNYPIAITRPDPQVFFEIA